MRSFTRMEPRPVRHRTFDYEPHTALLVVDVQNDFADPEGALYVRGAEEIVPLINREIEAAEALGALVVYSRDWHPPRTPHFRTEGGIWPPHCVRGTWGTQLFPGLRRAQISLVVRKGRGGEDGYSAFGMRDPRTGEELDTGLGTALSRMGVRRVVIAGLATDYCVKETALDALRLGLQTHVLADAVRAVELRPGDGARALDSVEAEGGHILHGNGASGASGEALDAR